MRNLSRHRDCERRASMHRQSVDLVTRKVAGSLRIILAFCLPSGPQNWNSCAAGNETSRNPSHRNCAGCASKTAHKFAGWQSQNCDSKAHKQRANSGQLSHEAAQSRCTGSRDELSINKHVEDSSEKKNIHHGGRTTFRVRFSND